MSTSPTYVSWFHDPELAEWILGIQLKRPSFAGRFLGAMASAARHANPEQYAQLRPLLLELKEHNPQYQAKIAPPSSSAPGSE